MYLGLSVCCLLILKIPHIPGKFLLPNRLLLFIVQHGWRRLSAPPRAEWMGHIRDQIFFFFFLNAEIWKDCNEGYFRKCALFVFNEHLPARCSSGRTAVWMASLWECGSFKQPLVNTLWLCPLWTRQQQTEPLFRSSQRERMHSGPKASASFFHMCNSSSRNNDDGPWKLLPHIPR